MPIQVLGFDGGAFDQNSVEPYAGRFLKSLVRLVFSGSYPTGGDTLDFTNAGGTPSAPSVVPPAQSRGLAAIDIRPHSKIVTGLAAVGGSYNPVIPGGVLPVPNSGVNALKLKIYLVTNAEYTAGAYGADVLGDIVLAELYWAR